MGVRGPKDFSPAFGSFDILSQVDSNLTLKKVGIQEFCESKEFCNVKLYPRQLVLLKLMFLEELTDREEEILDYWMDGGHNGEILISPHMRERIKWCRDQGYKHFREVLLIGGRRGSKGFITSLAMAYNLYQLLILGDPGRYYKISEEKEIYFSCVAASQDQAQKYLYADFSSVIGRCAALQNYITKIQELEFSVMTESDKATYHQAKMQNIRLGRDISKLRGAAFAANASTIRGQTCCFLAMDEIAHMEQEGESQAVASKVYSAAKPAQNQFGTDAMTVLLSSPYTKLGVLYERHQIALRDEEGVPDVPLAPNMFTFQFPSWALFEGYQEDPRFDRALACSPDWDPEEKKEDGTDKHSEFDKNQIREMRYEQYQRPEAFRVEFRSQFAEVLEAYLRPEMVDRMFAGRPTENGVIEELKTNFTEPYWGYRYKIHLDPSSTTAGFGMALAHTEDLEDPFGNVATHVVFDYIKRWEPRSFPNGVINWDTVLKEVFDLVRQFRPFEVTMDQHNSRMPIETLNRMCREHNLDTRIYEKTATSQNNWNRAEVFKTALYRGLVHAPNDTDDDQYCSEELKYLQQVNTSGRFPRVDKQDIGPVQTKDMADSCFECVEALIGNKIFREARESLSTGASLGALGGYAIGGIYTRARTDGAFQQQSGRQGEQSRVPGLSARERMAGLNSAARRSSWSGRRSGPKR